VLVLTKARMGEANKYFVQLIDTGLWHRSEHDVLRCVSLRACLCLFFPMAQHHLVGQGFLNFETSPPHSFRQTTLGRTPLGESSARSRDLYLTTHLTHKRQKSMPQPGLEPTIPANEWLQTYTLDHVATEICSAFIIVL